MTPDENKAVIRGFYEQWTAGAIDFDRLVQPDVTNHKPDREPERGLDAFRGAIEGLMPAVPDSVWKTEGKIADHWVVRDDIGMMLQVGAVTPSGA
jgi:hypothetical protein